MRTPLQLPSELTIFVAAELRATWLEWLATSADGHEPTVEAQAVDEVDAAGVQLLLSLARSLQARQLDLHIEQPSEALRSACRTLGAGHLLTPATGGTA